MTVTNIWLGPGAEPVVGSLDRRFSFLKEAGKGVDRVQLLGYTFKAQYNMK